MLENDFKFTGKDLIKLSVMMILATLLFGLPGLLMMLFLQWITNQTYALESAEKHGISQIRASRLGGAAIFASSVLLYIFAIITGSVGIDDSTDAPVVAWLAVFICMGIGLVDDLYSNLLSPRIRLVSILAVFSLCLCLVPSLIPKSLGIIGLDSLLAISIIGWLITAVFCTGFVNAINMADGANGLIPGTITISLIVFYLEADFIVYAILMTSCGLFTIFNVISGRLFLGDAGAYGLGSIIALNGLYQFSEGVFSAAFLAVLFSYPCIDIVVALIRRRFMGRSIFLPDNDHLHNRIYFYCQSWVRSKTLANSMTGVLIVSLSSGIALLGFIQNWWPVTSDKWIWIFLLQCVIYSLAFFVTRRGRQPEVT